MGNGAAAFKCSRVDDNYCSAVFCECVIIGISANNIQFYAERRTKHKSTSVLILLLSFFIVVFRRRRLISILRSLKQQIIEWQKMNKFAGLVVYYTICINRFIVCSRMY